MSVKAHAARGPKQLLEPFKYEPGPLGKHEVEVKVVCQSSRPLCAASAPHISQPSSL
jgi:hypothetical protein